MANVHDISSNYNTSLKNLAQLKKRWKLITSLRVTCLTKGKASMPKDPKFKLLALEECYGHNIRYSSIGSHVLP